MNRWWDQQEEECFWLESTDRADLGTDLNAPIYDDSGKENWRYTLLREVKRGDIVYHYHKKHRAIVSKSVVASPAVEDLVVWGARGTSAREKGVVPYERAGLRVTLEAYKELKNPISLTELREKASLIREAKEQTELRFGKPLYSPIELSTKRPARMLQGYLFKLPAVYLDILGLPMGVLGVPKLPEELSDEGVYYEGATKRISVNAYERDRKARQQCLRHWGYKCAVCGFDFEAVYGVRGRQFIHVHHLVPISTVGKKYKVNAVEDLRPVCPNCHAMLHKTKPPCSINELKHLMMN